MSGDLNAFTAGVLDEMLRLAPDQRKAAISALRYNGIFCDACGYGDPERPNVNCQCENDE